VKLSELNRPFEYRRTLPAAQTLAFVVLTVLGCPYIQDSIQRIRLDYHPHKIQPSDAGSVSWEPSCIDAAMSLSEQAAMGINFPAMLFSIVFEPVARKFELECRKGDYFMHASILLFVPILWYWVGCLLDGKPLVRSSLFYLNRTLVWSLLVIVAGVTALAAIGFTLIPELPLLQALVMAWLILALFALLRCVKSDARPITVTTSGR
jgi:hypothetical protein